MDQPHFVALVSGRLGAGGPGASIRDARTGAVTDLVKPPPEAGQFARVTSAGAGVFFLTCRRLHQSAVYRLEVGENGRAERLTPLPEDLLPAALPRAIAACPGGGTLAYTSTRLGKLSERTRTAEAGLVDLGSGRRRLARLPAGHLTDLSWAGDRGTVAFMWSPETGEEPAVYVTSTGAEDWIAAGRLVEGTRGLPDTMMEPIISADGGEIYCTVAQPDPRGGSHWNRLLAIPVHGGPPRNLFQLRYQTDSHNLHYMWTTTCRDETGHYLLAFATGYVYRIHVPTATFTRLPFPEGRPHDAAW